jgi:hypothetical protein
MAKRVEGMFSCMEDPIDMPAICWIRRNKHTPSLDPALPDSRLNPLFPSGNRWTEIGTHVLGW